MKQPYFIHCPSSEVIAFAALWATWARPGADPVVSCALLSKAAAPAIVGIHHRMSVVLSPDQYDRWLDLEGHRVGTRVNNARNNDASLLESA